MITELRIIFIWSLVIFMSLPAFSEIYVVTFRQTHSETAGDTRSNENQIKARESKESQPRTFIHKLVSILTHKKTANLEYKTQNKCIRLFGSIYGTQSQRQKCLERLKMKSDSSTTRLPEDYKEYSQWQYDPFHYDDIVYYEHEYPFSDFNKFDIPEEQVSDGIEPPNIGKLRTNKPTIYLISGYRRNVPHNVAITKRNMNVETSDESSGDDVETSDTNGKPTKTKTVVMHRKKPKRFQVINNGEYTDEGMSIQMNELTSAELGSGSTDTDNEMSSQSDEIDKKKKPKPKKPDKSKSTIDTVYLQGNHVVDLSSDVENDYRKRMPSFLPKRYHWRENEIHDLGYYWFNGPQGRYSLYAVRP